MANIKVKRGMGGSRCGKGRREPTAVLKSESSKARRAEGKTLAELEAEALAWERLEIRELQLVRAAAGSVC